MCDYLGNFFRLEKPSIFLTTNLYNLMNTLKPEYKVKAKGAIFHENLSDHWSEGYRKKRGFIRRINCFRSHLQSCVFQNSHWLDAGCGSGVLSRELSYLGANVVGVDGSPKMIAAAKLETGNSHGNIHYKEISTIESISEADSSFDGVLCSSVIEYVDDPVKAFGQINRVIKLHGILLISVPNRHSPIRLAQKILKSMAQIFDINLYSYLDFSKNDYSFRGVYQVMQSSGFIVDKIDNFDPLFLGILGKFRLGSIFVITAHKHQYTN